MKMNTIYGYWRCSTDAQDQERQIRSLKDAGCEQIVGDFITGTSNYGDRKELSDLLSIIQQGDLLILDELNRLGRTMVTMLVEVNKLLEKGVKIRTLDGRLDTTTMNKEIINLIVGVMGYSAEMELTNIRRRTAEGRAVAKRRGVKFGMKRKYGQHQVAEIMRKREQGEGYGTIGRAMGISRATVASIVKREKVAV
jgi:DNA invertase Pin-like site-specific DNA recombinase